MNSTEALIESLLACPAADLQAVVDGVARADPAKAFQLGCAVYEANPAITVPGAPPTQGHFVYEAALTVTGLLPGVDRSAARVAGIRLLRGEGCAVLDASFICAGLEVGHTHSYPVQPRYEVERRMKEWARAGFACVTDPSLPPVPDHHKETFQERFSQVCWA